MELRQRKPLGERCFGTVDDDEQDRFRVDGPSEHVEQVAGERVEPVAVLQDEHDRLPSGPGPQAVGEQVLE